MDIYHDKTDLHVEDFVYNIKDVVYISKYPLLQQPPPVFEDLDLEQVTMADSRIVIERGGFTYSLPADKFVMVSSIEKQTDDVEKE